MELVALLLLITFEGLVGGVAVLLSLTYVSFTRMEKDVRRARMFIMADRIKRFLGAFTAGFVVLAVVFAGGFLSLLGVVLPQPVTLGAFFFFLAMIAYGIVELFFIVRPRGAARTASGKTLRSLIRSQPSTTPPGKESVEDEVNATR
jgi:hypothetical protein